MLDRLAQCGTSSERLIVYTQFTGALGDYNGTVQKQMGQALESFRSRIKVPNTEVQLEEWEHSFENLLDERKFIDEHTLPTDLEYGRACLNEQVKKLRKQQTLIKRLATKVENDTYCRTLLVRVNRNEERLAQELKTAYKTIKLVRIKQIIRDRERNFAETICHLEKKEKEWRKRKEMVKKSSESFKTAEAEYQQRLQMRETLTTRWEGLVRDQHEQLGSLKVLWSFESIQEELDQISKQMSLAEAHLKLSKKLKDYLSELQDHSEALDSMKTFMNQQVDILIEHREGFQKSREELERIETTRGEYKQTMRYCDEKFDECEARVRQCQEGIHQVNEEYRHCLEDAKRTLQKLKECHKDLGICTADLETCEQRVTECLEKLKEKSKSLSRSIEALTISTESAKGFVGGAAVGLPIGSLIGGPIGASVAVGGVVLGSVFGFKRGIKKSVSIEEKFEQQRKKLNECEDSLKKCGSSITKLKKITGECQQEIESMQKCISEMENIRLRILGMQR